MQRIRDIFSALRAGWKAGRSQYDRTRWLQRTRAARAGTSPF